jgi:hypothetical protein
VRLTLATLVAVSGVVPFDGGVVTFDRPRAWHVYRYQRETTESQLVTYLSTQPLHDPCVRGDSGTLRCALPLDRLRRGGVFVDVTLTGYISTRRTGFGAGNATVDGYPARLGVARPADRACPDAADASLHAAVYLGGANVLETLACAREPNAARALAQARTLIRSMRFPRR